jgi:hypothetical protein
VFFIPMTGAIDKTPQRGAGAAPPVTMVRDKPAGQ